MDQVVDAVFAIECRSLPVDHAYALSQAVQAALPWFGDEPQAGLHTVHGAASGAGWLRPEGDDAQLQLSRRTKLVLRLPANRLADAAALTGRTLDVAGSALRVGRLSARPLLRIASLFSRSVIFEGAADESAFLAEATGALRALGVEASTMLCGRDVTLATPAGAEKFAVRADADIVLDGRRMKLAEIRTGASVAASARFTSAMTPAWLRWMCRMRWLPACSGRVTSGKFTADRVLPLSL